MVSDRAGSAEAPIRSTCEGSRADLERMRVASRQAVVIATLSQVVSTFHRGLRALRAENVELRAESDELRRRLVTLARGGSRAEDELVEMAIEAGPRAPGIARRVIAEALRDRVAAPALEDAQLLTSELVTNSVRHGRMPDGDELIVRVRIWQDRCRIEVEDPGCGGAIAPRSPDLAHGGGIGLNLVQALSEHWGLVRAGDGPTRVWAQVVCGTAADRASRPNLRVV